MTLLGYSLDFVCKCVWCVQRVGVVALIYVAGFAITSAVGDGVKTFAATGDDLARAKRHSHTPIRPFFLKIHTRAENASLGVKQSLLEVKIYIYKYIFI